MKLACPEVAFPENRLFERFWTLLTHNLQTRSVMSKKIWSRASLWYLTFGKNFMVIRPADPEIIGGGGENYFIMFTRNTYSGKSCEQYLYRYLVFAKFYVIKISAQMKITLRT